MRSSERSQPIGPEVPQPPSSVAVPPWLRDALRIFDRSRAHRGSPSCGSGAPVDRSARPRGHRARRVAESIRAAQPDAVISTDRAFAPRTAHQLVRAIPRALPGYAEGAFAVQEEGAQLIGLLLQSAARGTRVGCVCGARGQDRAVARSGWRVGQRRCSRSARAPSRADPRRARAAPVGLRSARRAPASIGRWAEDASRASSIGCSSTLLAPGSGPCAVGLKFYCVPGTKMRPAWVRHSAACSRTPPPWFDRVEPSFTRSALHCVTRVRGRRARRSPWI